VTGPHDPGHGPARPAAAQDGPSARVRRFLLDAGFTADGVLARVGSAAFAALGRGLTVPVQRALAGASDGGGPQRGEGEAHPGPSAAGPGGPQAAASVLDALIRAFLLGSPLPADALPADALADLVALGMLRRDGDALVPRVEVHPYGEPDTDWYLVSDIGAPAEPDHVLGLGGASLTLARITPRREVGRALDVGCGAGVQVLHAARHATRVVATDTNPRALAMTALSAALSGVPVEQVDLREGSLFGPVSDERFDLIVSNPPFVISPSHRFTYRDAGLPGDELSRLVVRGAAAHLAPGGIAAVLGNWLHVVGEQWTDRVAEWVAGTGADAWIVERDAQPVADYAATWLRDAGVAEGVEFDAAMQEWLDVFADAESTDVGFGWVVLVAPAAARQVADGTDDPVTGIEPDAAPAAAADARAANPDGAPEPASAADAHAAAGSGPTTPPAREPWVLAEDLSRSERLPRGDEVLAFLTGCQILADLPAPALLACGARLAEGATVTTTTHVVGGRRVDAPPMLGLAGSVGPGGWRAAVPVPPALLAALLAPADTPIGERLDAAAEAEGLDPLDVLGPALMALRDLVRMGIVRTD
jgi:methylase of polypeptide subunit release factors